MPTVIRGHEPGLYISEDGRIECAEHAPYNGSDTWRFGHYVRVTEGFVRLWVEEMGRFAGSTLPGDPPTRTAARPERRPSVSWLDRLSPNDRTALIDAGRIGPGRFEGPDPKPYCKYGHYEEHDRLPECINEITAEEGEE